jgi:hypothetical protein
MKPINSSDIVFFMILPLGDVELRGENFRWADLVQKPERERRGARL